MDDKDFFQTLLENTERIAVIISTYLVLVDHLRRK
jgi:hypothetical protein|nr:MAG TPA_asm: Cell death activator [Caudoviricetes sp.]